MEKHFVYILESTEGKKYIGYTSDLRKRLFEHNSGLSKWTKRYSFWRLIYQEEFGTRTEALKREKYLKSLKGGNGLRKILNISRSLPGA